MTTAPVNPGAPLDSHCLPAGFLAPLTLTGQPASGQEAWGPVVCQHSSRVSCELSPSLQGPSSEASASRHPCPWPSVAYLAQSQATLIPVPEEGQKRLLSSAC